MIPADVIVRNILKHMNREASATERAHVFEVMNKVYFNLCRKYSWVPLRRVTELAFSDAEDETGLVVPGNTMRIDRVRYEPDDDTGYEFFPRDRQDIEPDEYGFRYYFYYPSSLPLLYRADMAITSGTNSVTTAGGGLIAATHEDEYCRLGYTCGYYLIDDVLLATSATIAPYYYGPTLTSEDLFVRPPETYIKVVILDPDEEVLTDRDVNLYYCEAPQPLYRDGDVCVLPSSRVLELMTLREMPEAKLRMPVADGKIQDALNEALSMNPDYPRASSPRDKHNKIFDMRNSLFAVRGE